MIDAGNTVCKMNFCAPLASSFNNNNNNNNMAS